MNLRLVSRLIGIVGILIGLMMSASLPWAIASWGKQTLLEQQNDPFETKGFYALLISMVVSFLVGLMFLHYGKKGKSGKLFLKEAMAVVALSWVLATVLGALPYLLSETYRGSAVRLFGEENPPQVCGSNWRIWGQWDEQALLTPQQFLMLNVLQEAGWRGLDEEHLAEKIDENAVEVLEELREQPGWAKAIIFPGQWKEDSVVDENWRLKWVKMSIPDALFESQSGFSTTGATVITNLEDPRLVPHCILFWRSMTHFLGGLGIIVLFVTILGQGSAGKALMRAEMPGPTKEGSTARMQHTAWIFACLYCGLNAVLAMILWLLGMTPFDALCHAFGTMATGGFSTYNASLGAFFQADPGTGRAIEYVVTVFMILAGTNFTLLYLTLILQPKKLFVDIEWRVYASLTAIVTGIVLIAGLRAGANGFENYEDAFRNSLFQVVSIITTTGFGTSDFSRWPAISIALLFVLMFVGGCSGSTGGGMKIIRQILFFKTISLEVERAYRPRVVRPLRIGGNIVDDKLRHSILLYFALILMIFVLSALFVTAFEPDMKWGRAVENKLIDSASSVAATLNNIGPGLGIVGPTKNYANMTGVTKLLFVWLMMLGRLEIFSILALVFPGFWRD